MSDASELCLSCGLCCDGTLFDIVRLTATEAGALTRLGLATTQRGEHWSMAQPCDALQGTSCRIYPQRPSRCFAYRCHLLTALEEGEVSLAEARATVALGKELSGVQRLQFLDYHFLGRATRRR
jgi:hypothetical protein